MDKQSNDPAGRQCCHRAPRSRFEEPVRLGIWPVGFMHYDLGYFDLEQKTIADPAIE
jgi:hypothetical protein